MRILLVEDDKIISEQIAAALAKERLDVEVVRSGERALDVALGSRFNLIVLDIMLPKLDGWAVCERVRAAGILTPILMLTARDSIDDRVKGLQGGADDYLSKPFDLRELLARVHVLLRRDAVHRTGLIKIADLVIDSVAHRVERGGKEVTLTPREYALLEALARNEGRTLTREVILESIWNNDESLENTVNFHVTSLRKKIDAPFKQKLIHTVHGIGYVMRTE